MANHRLEKVLVIQRWWRLLFNVIQRVKYIQALFRGYRSRKKFDLMLEKIDILLSVLEIIEPILNNLTKKLFLYKLTKNKLYTQFILKLRMPGNLNLIFFMQKVIKKFILTKKYKLLASAIYTTLLKKRNYYWSRVFRGLIQWMTYKIIKEEEVQFKENLSLAILNLKHHIFNKIVTKLKLF